MDPIQPSKKNQATSIQFNAVAVREAGTSNNGMHYFVLKGEVKDKGIELMLQKIY